MSTKQMRLDELKRRLCNTKKALYDGELITKPGQDFAKMMCDELRNQIAALEGKR